ncbi:MAG: hypothetical protein HYV27_15265 [Candidatus Hydrogenedentes bacterium]|nr:hypothetical protein [Candidatus Hydrogenedentota bacterium]
MALLDADATFEEIQAAVLGNADYDVSNSTEKARAFIQACRMYLILLTDETEAGANRVREDPVKVREMLTRAEVWLRPRDTSGGMGRTPGHVRRFDLRRFR